MSNKRLKPTCTAHNLNFNQVILYGYTSRGKTNLCPKEMDHTRESAYKRQLLGDISTSAGLNVGGLTSYLKDEEDNLKDLRENPPGES